MLTPPTDNLYKFCSISGLVIILICMYFGINSIQELEAESINLNTDVQVFTLEMRFLSRDIDLINFKIEEETKKAKEDINFTDLPHQQELDIYQQKLVEQGKKQLLIDGKIDLINKKLWWMHMYKIFFPLFNVFGLLLGVYGFKNWITIQKKMDKKI